VVAQPKLADGCTAHTAGLTLLSTCTSGLQIHGANNVVAVSANTTLLTGPFRINVPVRSRATGELGKQQLPLVCRMLWHTACVYVSAIQPLRIGFQPYCCCSRMMSTRPSHIPHIPHIPLPYTPYTPRGLFVCNSSQHVTSRHICHTMALPFTVCDAHILGRMGHGQKQPSLKHCMCRSCLSAFAALLQLLVGNASSWYRFLTVTCMEKAAPTAGKVHRLLHCSLQDRAAAQLPVT
jgi:hypothetical protein